MKDYSVDTTKTPAIIHNETGVIIMLVTSEDYAQFLCDKLNDGSEDESSITKRPAPDEEFFVTRRYQH